MTIHDCETRQDGNCLVIDCPTVSIAAAIASQYVFFANRCPPAVDRLSIQLKGRNLYPTIECDKIEQANRVAVAGWAIKPKDRNIHIFTQGRFGATIFVQDTEKALLGGESLKYGLLGVALSDIKRTDHGFCTLEMAGLIIQVNLQLKRICAQRDIWETTIDPVHASVNPVAAKPRPQGYFPDCTGRLDHPGTPGMSAYRT